MIFLTKMFASRHLTLEYGIGPPFEMACKKKLHVAQNP